jgi:hypothetical protein
LFQTLIKIGLWNNQDLEVRIPLDKQKLELQEKVEYFKWWWKEEQFYQKFKEIQPTHFLSSDNFSHLSKEEFLKISDERFEFFDKYNLTDIILTRKLHIKDLILNPINCNYMHINSNLEEFSFWKDLSDKIDNSEIEGYGINPSIDIFRGLKYQVEEATQNDAEYQTGWGRKAINEWTSQVDEYKKLFPHSYTSQLPWIAYLGVFNLSILAYGRAYSSYGSLTRLVEIIKSSILYQEITKAFQTVFDVDPIFAYTVNY